VDIERLEGVVQSKAVDLALCVVCYQDLAHGVYTNTPGGTKLSDPYPFPLGQAGVRVEDADGSIHHVSYSHHSCPSHSHIFWQESAAFFPRLLAWQGLQRLACAAEDVDPGSTLSCHVDGAIQGAMDSIYSPVAAAGGVGDLPDEVILAIVEEVLDVVQVSAQAFGLICQLVDLVLCHHAHATLVAQQWAGCLECGD